jgi:hypothetical protein
MTLFASYTFVGFEVLSAVSIKSSIIWDIMPRSLIEVLQLFSETLANFYRTVRHFIAEDITVCELYASSAPAIILTQWIS